MAPQRKMVVSLKKLFNNIKSTLIIPDFFQQMTITSIQKNKKKSKLLLSNTRGIFNLSKVRSLIDKLIYQDIYEKVDKHLSFSNAGGRKGRGSRDQLFIIYGIINDVIHGESSPVDLLSETNNDLWDVSVNDDRFSL